MKLATLVRIVPPDLQIVLADIGSAGGLHPRWNALRPLVRGMLFEPRDGGEPTVVGRDLVFPIALGPVAGRSTLNITALANMSSTLTPNAALLETFAKKPAHAAIVGEIELPVDTLDAVAERSNLSVDVLKADTQGSELGILQGAIGTLSADTVLAEVEVSLFERYTGQALLCDIVAFMDARGFELIELHRLKRYRRRNGFGIGNLGMGGGQRAGRLAYGDAIFLLKEAELRKRIAARTPEQGESLVLKTVLALLAYGKADMAAYVVEVFGADLREPWRGRLHAWFARLGRRPLGSGILHHAFDYLARHV